MHSKNRMTKSIKMQLPDDYFQNKDPFDLIAEANHKSSVQN